MEKKLTVKLLSHTPEPEISVARAAHMCYAGVDVKELKKKVDEEYAKKLLKHLIESGHWSVLEHANFTFAIEGVSRALTHQLVRHRIASYSQQSQRYVNEEEFFYIIPPFVSADEKKKKTFEEFMEKSREYYKKLVEDGVAKEDARFVLPNAAETRIIVTMNARALLNFFERRCCTRAQWEIRNLANEMLKQCKQIAPNIFENAGAICERLGYCPEKQSCGRFPLKKDVIKK
jgi:thymidylate synthase (FAD)